MIEIPSAGCASHHPQWKRIYWLNDAAQSLSPSLQPTESGTLGKTIWGLRIFIDLYIFREACFEYGEK